ncbi:MAG: hypothetical protein ACYTDY_00105 [Planctomycetota bacterium]|jgi:hypothetical protein
MRATVLVITFVSLLGCRTQVEIEDRGIAFPTLLASYRVAPREKPPRQSDEVAEEPRRPAEPEVYWSVEARYSRASGESSQSLNRADDVEFDREEFDGPGRLEADYTLEVVSVVLAVDRPLDLGFRLFGSGGIEVERLDLDLEMNGLRASDTLVSAGPGIAGGLEFRPIRWFGVRVQGRSVTAVGDGSFVSHYGLEVGAAIRPIEGVSVFGGWRWWAYAYTRRDSDILLDLSGPILGVSLGF